MAGGKKYTEAVSKIDRDELYSPEDAVKLVTETATRNFDETIDIAVRLGVDPKHADQIVRGTVVLPHGTGKTVRVCVIAKGEKVTEAEEAGADVAGGEDVVEKIQGGWMEFDVAVATPDMMSVVGKLGRVLGPRGLMPNPKAGTVTFDIAETVKELKAGKIEYRTDKTGIVHVPIGKASFDDSSLVDNFNTIIDQLIRSRPAAAKGQYLRSIVISSTMGPGIPINPTLAAKASATRRAS